MLASLGVLVFAATASAQTFDPTGWASVRTDTGPSTNGWKVTGPSGPSDWFNVNLGGLATGFAAHGVLFDGNESIGVPGLWKELGFRTSNALGDPDVSLGGLIVAQNNAPMAAGDGWGDEYGWTVPITTLGTDVHAVCTWFGGDSHLWANSDNDGVSSGRSAWTLDGYATAGNAFSPDMFIGAVGFPAGYQGSLLINGGSSGTVGQGGTVCLTFSACAANAASALYLFTPLFFGPLLPISLTITGNPVTGGPLPNQWTVCYTLTCSDPTGGPFGLGTIYLDPCDLKPNGKPKAKVSTSASLTITPAKACAGCFGLQDDEGYDGSGWVVQLPAGPSDYFNVNHGSPQSSSNVSNITGVEVATWDLCGTGATWANVGVYPDLAAMPGTPDVSSPFAVDPNPSFAPGTFDTAYPATMYAVPSFAASTTTTYHAVVQWSPAESCIAVNADTTGDAFTCATPLGGTAMTSAWTLDGYATGALYVNYANWMMAIRWN
jgi:hypothetical protein